MLYTPPTGRFKDNCVFWHEGEYYLFSMYEHGGENYRSVWLARSGDGVHWRDVGPVIDRAEFLVWAMAVHRVGDRFILNHGSFTTPDLQNVLRLWESRDLVHWTYMGAAHDVMPDERWYDRRSRLDCMNVIRVEAAEGQRYYGYATGPGGFLESADGIHWSGMPRPVTEWGDVPPPPTPEDEGGFEVGGCCDLEGRYYLLGGWFNYMGAFGYGVYTLVADTPTGPFRPDAAAYRLCGNSERWVSLWARPCRTPAALLISSYMYDGYSYETGQTWLPPLKMARADAGGHLRLAYWHGNEALKGPSQPLDPDSLTQVHPTVAAACHIEAGDRGVDLVAGPEQPSFDRPGVPAVIALAPAGLDFARGVVIEGTVEATCDDRRLVAPEVGFVLADHDRQGTALLLEAAGRTRIGRLRWSAQFDFASEDVIGPGCASPMGIAPHRPHRFRLLVRRNMFEFYLDDLHVQTYNTTSERGTTGPVPATWGLLARNGRGIFRDISIAPMTLG